MHGMSMLGDWSDPMLYCERRYFRVYTFSRTSENWQFRADLYSCFFLYCCPLCGIIKVIFQQVHIFADIDKRE